MKQKRWITMALGLLAAVLPAECQQIDWAKLFEDLSSGNSVLVQAATERLVDVVGPQITTEKPELAAAEIPAVVVQLNRSEDAIRTRASGLLMIVALMRMDSSVVLSAAVPALINHVQDPVAQVRSNSLNTLCILKPEIPPGALQFLIGLVEGSNDDLAMAAVSGVARMADTRIEAADAVEKATESHSIARRTAAIKAIGSSYLTGTKVVSHLGTLLADHDDVIVRAALEAIGNLGAAAIRLNSPQIDAVAENSTNKELATLARELLKQQAPQR